MAGLANAGPSIQTTGTLFSGISAYYEGKRQADIQSENIALTRQAASDQTRESRRQTDRSISTARARLAASGVMIDDDAESPLAIMEEILRLGEEDIVAISQTANTKERQARLRAQSALAKGSNKMFSSFFSAGSTILTRSVAKKKGIRIK